MITIKLFGLIKALAGNQADLTVALHGSRRVKDLIAELESPYPQVAELIHKKKVLVSVNQEIAHQDTEIRDGDEVALLPPFAGGADQVPVSEDAALVRVQRENFSIDAEIDRVRRRSTRIGGIATFLGTARDRSKGRDVSGITFEHYEGMAQKKLREIRERALTDFNILEVLILHRYGPIDVGENIVLIVVGAEHRADAFQACRWCIDELKQITPIWKLEQTPDGQVWVEEHP
ncbi:MAG TPA: molybdenum cofactor biosynthesis protein MoaE [Nitrospiraceae bacterium]|nr:molybdenum cofactor biosynthesis protein MoaE [Nitrospiraceae bacterium]